VDDVVVEGEGCYKGGLLNGGEGSSRGGVAEGWEKPTREAVGKNSKKNGRVKSSREEGKKREGGQWGGSKDATSASGGAKRRCGGELRKTGLEVMGKGRAGLGLDFLKKRGEGGLRGKLGWGYRGVTSSFSQMYNRTSM